MVEIGRSPGCGAPPGILEPGVDMGRKDPYRSQTIASPQNPRIKRVMRLFNKRERELSGLTVIEGVPEITRALQSNVRIEEVFYCPEIAGGEDGVRLLAELEKGKVEITPVARRPFERMAYRKSTGGIIAVAGFRPLALEELPKRRAPLYVVAEAIEKPGNLGAIMRSADGAGASGLIVSGHGTDITNPNVIRASIGTVFTVPTATAASADVIEWLKNEGIRLVVSTPGARTTHTEADLAPPCALVVGSEHSGVCDLWLESADLTVAIPMRGRADSLNVAASTAVLLFEAIRQGKEKAPLRKRKQSS